MRPTFDEFKEFLHQFMRNSVFFFFWGFLLTLFFDPYPSQVKNQIESVLLESLSVKTIVLIFCLETVLIGLFMVLFGNLKNENCIKFWIYHHLILLPSQFGRDFSAAAFGLLCGVAVSCYVGGYAQTVEALLCSSLKVLLLGMFMAYFPFLVKEERVQFNSRGFECAIGLVLLFLSVIIFMCVFLELK